MTTKLSIPAEIEQEIIYPDTDGLPLPDSLEQEPYFIEILATLKAFLEGLDVLVSGNTIIYYVEGDPSLSVAPDCYVALGVSRAAILERHLTYRVWEAGKFPDFVLEIGSPSTADNDLGPKRDLYARLGALEYWRYDPTGGDYYGEPLVGEYLVEGEYRRFELVDDPDGLPRAHSPLLNLDLRWEEDRLRFYDPASGRWLENNVESIARAEAEHDARMDAEARAETAEARMAEMEAELRRLRGE
ncbi:MAG: Uma2 family endonuclease [Dehalococcoidia bacterium]|nr:Uma2 family endonuclease [Dehalococcoidia bacterium]